MREVPRSIRGTSSFPLLLGFFIAVADRSDAVITMDVQLGSNSRFVDARSICRCGSCD